MPATRYSPTMKKRTKHHAPRMKPGRIRSPRCRGSGGMAGVRGCVLDAHPISSFTSISVRYVTSASISSGESDLLKLPGITPAA